VVKDSWESAHQQNRFKREVPERTISWGETGNGLNKERGGSLSEKEMEKNKMGERKRCDSPGGRSRWKKTRKDYSKIGRIKLGLVKRKGYTRRRNTTAQLKPCEEEGTQKLPHRGSRESPQFPNRIRP